jgi:hypothetical protein
MPTRDRAAYMRDYRARQRARTIDEPLVKRQAIRIAELEDEVRRLKRELAARLPVGPAFNSRPFTPVPKR